VTKGVRISLVLAAILSVVSIPVIVFLVSRNQGAAWTTVGSIAAVVAGLASFLFATVTYAKASEIRLSVHIMRWFNLEIAYRRIPSGNTPQATEDTAEARLLHELSAMEQEAQALLGQGPNTSVIRLRTRLQELGVWSRSDVYDFDVALRTRNKVAHGDQEELSTTSVVEAVETMHRLRQKLEASQLGADS
jgi:hypothetical protein